MEKSPDAFRNISEVAADLDLPQHVLRFWETRFTQIKPLKRGGGRRYYRPEDVDLLRAIRHLLYEEGYTIKGVQRILKDHGARAVAQMALTQMGAAAPTQNVAPSDPASPQPQPERAPPVPPPFAKDAVEPDIFSFEPPLAPPPAPPAPRSELDAARDAMRPLHDPRLAPPRRLDGPPARRDPVLDVRPTPAEAPRLLATFRAADHASGLGSQDVERLKAVLYELAECERVLAAARRS